MPDTVLVIGGGPAGLEAARSVAELGAHAIVVERRAVLGGTPDEAGYAALTPRMGSAQEALDELRRGVEHPDIEVHLETAVTGCGGSRDRRLGNEYCSKVCCGVASKEAIEIRRLLPDTRVYIFYIDMRMYGYWENEIYWPAQEQYNVNYIRGIVTEITSRDGRLLMKGEDTTMGRPLEVLMDVIVLSVGMEPSQGTRTVAGILGVEQNKYGFIATPGEPMDPVSTSVPGIYVAGAAAGPKDLEDTVSMAGAAAMRAILAARGQARSGVATAR